MRYTVRPISDRTEFTGKHQRSQFDSTWTATLQLLGREITHLDGRDVVLEVDVTERFIRNDGMLHAKARPTSPGVRLAFESKHGPLTYATDRFTHWQDNVRAIALGLEALRKVDRYGITKRGEQYTGWKALPAGRPMQGVHMSRDEARSILLEAAGWGAHVDDWAGWGDTHLEAKVLRSARATAHPDRHAGSQMAWDQVEQAAKVLGVSS